MYLLFKVLPCCLHSEFKSGGKYKQTLVATAMRNETISSNHWFKFFTFFIIYFYLLMAHSDFNKFAQVYVRCLEQECIKIANKLITQKCVKKTWYINQPKVIISTAHVLSSQQTRTKFQLSSIIVVDLLSRSAKRQVTN